MRSYKAEQKAKETKGEHKFIEFNCYLMFHRKLTADRVHTVEISKTYQKGRERERSKDQLRRYLGMRNRNTNTSTSSIPQTARMLIM